MKKIIKVTLGVIIGLTGISWINYFSLPLKEIYETPQKIAASGEWIEDETLYYGEFGKKKKETMLILPGSGAWTETWRLTQQALENDGIRSIAIDLPPFGLSIKENFNPELQATKVLNFLKMKDLKNVTLVGQSSQAETALEALIKDEREGGRIARLILVNPFLVLNEDAGVFPRAYLLGDFRSQWMVEGIFKNPGLCEWMYVNYLTIPWLYESKLKEMSNKEAHGLIEKEMKTFDLPFKTKGMAKATCSWANYLSSQVDIASRNKKILANIKKPVVIIKGKDDALMNINKLARFQEINPYFVLREYGYNHYPELDDPIGFAENLIGLKNLNVWVENKKIQDELKENKIEMRKESSKTLLFE